MTPATLAVATGDPLGVGPEVFCKALRHEAARRDVRMIVLGGLDVLRRAARQTGVELTFRAAADLADVRYEPDVLDVLELGYSDLTRLPQGHVHAQAGRAAVDYVIRSAELALGGGVDAVVTGPIHKEAVQAAGYTQYIGNTEIFEDICSRHTGQDYRGRCMTMLITKSLRVAHVTRHVPFKDIVSRLTPEALERTIRLTAAGMVSLGLSAARIGVAGLNPHNGEHGLMGREELDVVAPVVVRLREAGLNVSGPIPADSIFFKAIGGEFDAVVALYHDQGHIAVKVHGFEESITVSLGIPVIRTSVDHGTAFDIAGRGIATEKSMLAAIALARDIVRQGSWAEGLAAAS
ncbi:MAG: 4-hydroxythreonine-4-phosphate dehydrogenase PdxA [Candidatus Lambdaproteobacteria bacterium]|nr:4-hydroxythreonine-4-phosphate dehydrogenase PdxA [Candidatus Lambdaproteobacteria bacterium]